MSVQELWGKCKSQEFFIAAVVILVGLGAFGLGRLSTLEEKRQPIKIEYPGESAAAAAAGEGVSNFAVGASKTNPSLQAVPLAAGGLLVASKAGTKYHYPWCSGAKNISETNKIWFNSEKEARAAGYEPAGNCKGLK